VGHYGFAAVGGALLTVGWTGFLLVVLLHLGVIGARRRRLFGRRAVAPVVMGLGAAGVLAIPFILAQ
jgi:hypothetical protein